MPFEAPLIETEDPPVYQNISEEVENLSLLGLSNCSIAQHLGVNDKTVAKAIRWRS